jgi:predicted metal-binding protein
MHVCSFCANEVEIWSDETHGICFKCGKKVYIGHSQKDLSDSKGLETSEGRFDQTVAGLISKAVQLGAASAVFIASDKIVIEDALANLCREPLCDNFGLSASCPPHVPGPAQFRQWLKASKGAIFFKIEVPTESLFAEDRREIMGLLHHIASQTEQDAIEQGYVNSKAFAGGSCRKIFCHEKADCAVLSNEKCRNPSTARPSMSGFGVNVAKLIEVSGWGSEGIPAGGVGKQASFSALYGLVLIAIRASA